MNPLPADDKSKITTAQRKKARRLVVQALYQWHMSGSSISQIMAEFCVDNDMSKVDANYFKEMLGGIPKQVDELDQQIKPLLDRSLTEVDPIELCLLRMGTYEFIHRIDVPYKVVINEAVELAKSFGGTDGHKYINSILHKLSLRLRKAETRKI